MLSSLFSLVLLLYFISFYLVFGFDEWFLVWVGLELNMISFLVLGYKSSEMLVVEGVGSYFFVQSLASGGILGMVYLGWSDVVWGVLLCLKMGVGPFFFWYVWVVRSFTWGMNFVLMVFQKIILLFLLSEVISFFFWGVGFISLMVGLFGVIGQVNLKFVLGYSSIHHSGWMLCLLMVEDFVWGLYLLCYGVMMFSVIMIFKQLGSVMFLGLSDKASKMFVLAVFNLGGIPPLVGFAVKWFSFYCMGGLDYIVLIFLAVFSVGMLYVYLRMVYDVVLLGFVGGGWGLELIWEWKFGEVFSLGVGVVLVMGSLYFL